MKKIYLWSLVSVLPLTCFLNQTNSTLKSKQLLNGEWIENEQIEQEKSHAPQLLKNKTNIYSNKQIDIGLIENNALQTIAVIKVKKVEKKYYLSLQNNHFYNRKQLQNFIKAKFYNEKTSQHFIPASRFYYFLDTKDCNSEITRNSMVEFRSSWGVYNQQEVESSIKFNLRKTAVEESIWFHDYDNLPKNTTLEKIEVETIEPKKIGLLPIAQIHKPPIRDATWKTNKIAFNDRDNYKIFPYQKQFLKMPEGHDSGLEWWKGITSTAGIIVSAVISAISAFVPTKIVALLISGALSGGFSQLVGTLIDMFIGTKMKDSTAAINKLYNKCTNNCTT